MAVADIDFPVGDRNGRGIDCLSRLSCLGEVFETKTCADNVGNGVRLANLMESDFIYCSLAVGLPFRFGKIIIVGLKLLLTASRYMAPIFLRKSTSSSILSVCSRATAACRSDIR